MRKQYNHKKRSNGALWFGLGLLIGTVLPCQMVLIISAIVICIISLFAGC